MDAVILLNKPAGMTSFDAVRRCRMTLHEKKAGHTGTLDPQASGLMIVLLGRYTKLLPYCTADRKTYHAEFRTGIRTDTEDIWGNVIEEKETSFHSDEELENACAKMRGQIMQVPPMYSALKVNGRKLYEYARKGIEVERQPRPVTVHSLTVRRTGEDTYEMDACVSAGTYIRTLIADYCASLEEIGTMTSLIRSGIGSLKLEDACGLDDLNENSGIDPLLAVSDIYEITEAGEHADDIMHGRSFALEDAGTYIMFVQNGSILAAYEKRQDGLYHCARGLY